MLETFLSGSVLARLINSALRLDPAARDKLAALNGPASALTSAGARNRGSSKSTTANCTSPTTTPPSATSACPAT